MEHADWMNEQVRGEIESLQHTHGFEEKEAVAFWHLRQAGGLMRAMKEADTLELARRGEEAVREAALIYGMAQTESRVLQHFSALYRELGARVLRRNFPDGWGTTYTAPDEEEA